MTVLVVDASVGVKWFATEVHSAEARRLQGTGYELHVPVLFDVELGNVAWKKLRKGELTRAQADTFVLTLVALPLVRHPVRDLAEAAFGVAADTGRTVYDAVYLALATRLGVQLVTADEKFRNALVGTDWEPHLLWVADIP